MADREKNVMSPKQDEGLRGDGTPKWYVME